MVMLFPCCKLLFLIWFFETESYSLKFLILLSQPPLCGISGIGLILCFATVFFFVLFYFVFRNNTLIYYLSEGLRVFFIYFFFDLVVFGFVFFSSFLSCTLGKYLTCPALDLSFPKGQTTGFHGSRDSGQTGPACTGWTPVHTQLQMCKRDA